MPIEPLGDPRLCLLTTQYIRIAPDRWNYRDISRPHWLLYWNRNPGALIRYERRIIKLQPASVVLIAPHTVFSTSVSNYVDHLFMHFQIHAFYTGVAPHITVFALTPPVRALIKELIHLLHNPPPSDWQLSLISRALAELLVSKLMDKTIKIPHLDARILAALACTDENPGGETSNAFLAQRAGMSVSAFKRLFKAQMMRTPQSYVRLKRVDKACMMLLSEVSIKQIAEATGFCDRYHFSRTFKQIQKIAPAKYRRQNCSLVVAPRPQDKIAGVTRR